MDKLRPREILVNVFLYLVFLYLIIFFLLGAGWVLGSISDRFENQVTTVEQQLSSCQQQLQTAEDQVARDDRIFNMLLGSWDRDQPILSKQVTITAYTSRPEETDDTPYITACNTPVTVGGVAVSRDLFELLGGCGAPLAIIGKGTFQINDKMNSRFSNSVDIWSGDLGAARLHGRQTARMVWQ